MLKRRSVFALGAALVLAVVLVPLIAAIILPKERIVQELARRVESASGWKLTVGDAGIRWYPFALRLEGVKLEGNPAFADSSRIEVPEARVEIALGDLFRRRLRVSKVRIERPAIDLVVARRGAAAAADGAAGPGEGGGGDAARDGAAAAAAPLALSLSRLDVEGAHLVFEDTTGFALRLDDLSLSLGLEAGARLEKFDIAGSFASARAAVTLPVVAAAPGAGGELASDADAGAADSTPAAARTIALGEFRVTSDYALAFTPADQTLSIAKATIVVNDLPASVSGTVTNLARTPACDVTIEARETPIAQLLSLLPESVLAQKEKLDASGRATINARLLGPTWPPGAMKASGSVAIEESRVAFAGIPGAIEELRGTVRFSDERLDIDSLVASFEGSPLRVEGSVAPLADPRVDVRVAGGIPLGVVGRWPVMTRFQKLSGDVRLDVRATGAVRAPQAMRLDGNVDLASVSVQPAGWTAPIEGLTGRVALAGTTARIESLRGALGASDFAVTGAIEEPLAKPRARVDVTSRVLDLDALVRIAGGAAAPAAPAGAASIAAPLMLPELPDIEAFATIRAESLIVQAIPLRGARGEATLRDRVLTAKLNAGEIRVPSSPLADARLDLTVKNRRLDGNFSAASITLPRVPLTNVSAKIAVTPDGVIDITSARANAFTGSVGGDVRVTLAGGEPRYTFSVAAKDLEMNDFLSHLTPAKNLLYGKLKLDGKFEGAGLTAEAAKEKLKADGAGFAVDGRMVPNPVLLEIASLLGIPEMQEIRFRTLKSTFRIDTGRVRVDDLELLAPDAKWNLAGSAGFDGTIDYSLSILLSKPLADRVVAKVGAIARYLVNEKGELPVDIVLGGTATRPKVSLDLSKASSRVKGGALGDAARALGIDEKALADPKSALEDPNALRNLLGGALGGRDAAPAPAPSPAPDATPATPPPAAPPDTAAADSAPR